ncbi:MAG: hypothetical protein CME66_13065 [Halobacteriovoraceae bacterium]|nr:hypothetical protein [Halobacteriovoraceae bacterium]
MSNLCPCGSENEYQSCCMPYHKNESLPPTAEKLMRARYSAFVKNEIPFIAQTHLPGTEDFDIEEARNWAVDSQWKGLEIVNSQKGQADHQSGIVEFKALYADKEGKDYLHHEISTFKKIDDQWYYEDGQIVGTGPIKRATPKVGRNEPCPCHSGKKYKKCCGA